MTVWLNGQPRAVEPPLTLASLLEAVGAPREGVAVERNGAIVRRRDHVVTALADGDRIELVTLVGGG
jgi:thiamine biosynthesis protein ThiS